MSTFDTMLNIFIIIVIIIIITIIRLANKDKIYESSYRSTSVWILCPPTAHESPMISGPKLWDFAQ